MKWTFITALALAALGISCASHRYHTESHLHGPSCGHVAIVHEGHTDYVHEGHLHHPHDGHVDDHSLAVNAANPNQCTPDHACGAHAKDHKHGPNCGHEAVPHDGHTDYLVSGHLHHPDGDHCDNHGAIQLAAR